MNVRSAQHAHNEHVAPYLLAPAEGLHLKEETTFKRR